MNILEILCFCFWGLLTTTACLSVYLEEKNNQKIEFDRYKQNLHPSPKLFCQYPNIKAKKSTIFFDFLFAILYQYFNNMEIKENRKNLFIQLTEGVKQQSIATVLNNWSRPPPLQYHLINTPALTFELASLPSQAQKFMPDFFRGKSRDMAKVPKRNRERDKFKRLRQELKVLSQGLKDFKDLHESQLLGYKQTLLIDYLSKFIQEIASECSQKADFLKQIWNLLIKVFEGLFDRIVSDNKRREGEFLRDQIATHTSYQQKLQEYKKKNNELRESDEKYQNIIRDLMNNIARLNAELKGQRSLFDKTAMNLSEIAHKYEELRSQYLEILVNGFSSTMTREQAELQLTDKQLLLFAKYAATGNHGVTAKKGKVRKAKIINNDIDVNLLLQEIQAEDDFSFQIDFGEKKEVNYANQRVQTTFLGYQGQNMGIQCDYISRTQQGIIKNKSSQTNPPSKVFQRDVVIQTNKAEFLTKQLELSRIFSYIQYPIRVESRNSIKLVRNTSNQCVLENTLSRRQPHMEDAFTSFTIKDIQQVTPPSQNNDRDSVAVDRREGKMIRISSKDSNRSSKAYFQKTVKTQASVFKNRNSQTAQKFSKRVRLSEFLVLENLKQSIIRNVSNFKKNQNSSISLQQKLSIQLLDNHTKEKSIKESIDNALTTYEVQFSSKDKSCYQNLQLFRLNSQVQEKINAWQNLQTKKMPSLLPTHKCLKAINQIYKLARKFISAGCNTVNLISITCDYLSAIEGKTISVSQNHKKLIDFLRSCLNMHGQHYIIKNFIMLCGLQAPNKDERLVKMSKISFDSLKSNLGVDRLNHTSDFKFSRETRQTQEQAPTQQSYSKMVYYSQTILYFELLDALNCSQSKEDLSKYYTTYQRFEDIIDKIGQHYRHSMKLVFQIKEAVKLSIEDWGNENQSKLNIYKCIQLIMEKVLNFKLQLETEFNHILDQYFGNHMYVQRSYIDELINMAGVSQSQYSQLAIIAHQCYQMNSMSDLATLFMIEGIRIDLSLFVPVQKDHKGLIMKKLIQSKESTKGVFANLIQSYEKKCLKKSDFHFLLRKCWIKASSKILEEIIGDDLACLFKGSIPYGDSSIGTGFHKIVREAFQFS